MARPDRVNRSGMRAGVSSLTGLPRHRRPRSRPFRAGLEWTVLRTPDPPGGVIFGPLVTVPGFLLSSFPSFKEQVP
jgi:hypothetical protein